MFQCWMFRLIPKAKYSQKASNETSDCVHLTSLLGKRQNKSRFGIKYFTLINNRIVLRTNKKKKSTNKPRLLPNFVQNNYNDLHIQSLRWDEHEQRCTMTEYELWLFKITKKPTVFFFFVFYRFIYLFYQTGLSEEAKPSLLLFAL